MSEKNTDFDAIVIGSGISGGWAAKELCERGLKTLVLERGRMVEHKKNYPPANYHPWDMPHRVKIPPPEMDKIQSLATAMRIKRIRNIFL